MSRALQAKRRSFRITIELPEPLLRSLERIAAVRGSTIEQVVLAAVKQYVSIVEAVESGYTSYTGKPRRTQGEARARKG